MAKDVTDTIPRWYQPLAAQMAIALLAALFLSMFLGTEIAKAWMAGALVAGLPHAVLVYFAGADATHDASATLRLYRRGWLYKLLLTASFIAVAFAFTEGMYALPLLTGFIAVTLIGALYPVVASNNT